MHAIRHTLAVLACACIGAASASTVTLQLTDLTYSAYSLNPQGSSASVSLQSGPYHAAADLLGTREERHQDYTGSYGTGAFVWGASTRTENAASAAGEWGSNINFIEYEINADAYINDPLSQWYFAQSRLDASATLTLTPNSALVVSGHLIGTSELVDTGANGVFSAALDGGGASAEYGRAFGSGTSLGSVNDFFTLTLFNKTNDDMAFSWKMDAELTASRPIPAIPEPSFVSMALAGVLMLAMPHAAGVLRRQRIRAKYPAVSLQWLDHSSRNCGGLI